MRNGESMEKMGRENLNIIVLANLERTSEDSHQALIFYNCAIIYF